MGARKVQRAGRTRRLTVLGQDPSVLARDGKALTVQVEVPVEALAPGPRGARVHVVDFDASTNTFYRPFELGEDDAWADERDLERLVTNPHFHAQNVWAITMATLTRFESALGRRASWAVPGGGSSPGAAPGHGHILKVAPHAFAEANAYYSRRDEGLLFGYFPARDGKPVFTCLSHDVVVHETTHALVDGLRPHFTEPSSVDQAAFHEGFADVVALLSVFRHDEVINTALQAKGERIRRDALTVEKLATSVLLGLAKQVGRELTGVRGDALRRSVELKPEDASDSMYREEPHRRGEVLVAAVMRAFLEVWVRRLTPLVEDRAEVDRGRVVEEGADAASHLLSMVIRAIDYTPPIDVQFSDFLSALLTADAELYPDDRRYRYREALVSSCAAYGIHPVKTQSHGAWDPPRHAAKISLARNHFESLKHDADEAFAFVWENQKLLELHPEAYTWVSSVRPVTRVDVDGFTLRETVAEYVQSLSLRARELRAFGIKAPKGMPGDTRVRLNGGGVLVFDEFGRLKFHIGSGVRSQKQTDRLEALWQSGFYSEKRQQQPLRRFAQLHLERALPMARFTGEGW